MAQTLTGYIVEKASQNRSDAKSKDDKKSDKSRKGGNVTLTDFLINRKKEKKSRSRSGTSNTLTAALFQRMRRKEEKEKREEQQKQLTFEQELKNTFKILSQKTEDIKVKVYELGGVLSDITEQEMILSQNMIILNDLFSQRSMLEKAVFTAVAHRFSDFPKIEVKEAKKQPETDVSEDSSDTEDTDLPNITPPRENPLPTINPPSSPDKKAEGGIQPGVSEKNEVKSVIPYADIMQLPLQAAGIASVNLIGEFISKSGVLGGFFTPYLRSAIKPFALALGVGESIFNTLLSGPVNAAEREKNAAKRDFGKTWSKFLKDPDFVGKYIDKVDIEDGETPPGYVPAKWEEDPEFVAVVNDFAKRYKLSAPGLLALMARESGLRPYAENSKSGAVGLIQIMNPESLGTTKADLKKMTRSQQMAYVEKYLVKVGIKEGMTPADVYALVYLPGRYADRAKGEYGSAERMSTVLTKAGEDFYESNTGLDANGDGETTLYDLLEELKKTAKSYKIEGFESGGYKKGAVSSTSPYLVSGPETGYDAIIQGYPVELHGTEIIEPKNDGFMVFPVKNKKYNIFEDPFSVMNRWKQIAKGSNTQPVQAFSSGGSADFWKIAALASKEDSLHSQGQADIAQALYNRAAIGSYPGGKSIGSIITAPGQFQPTFNNAGAWASIRDRQSAIAAAGNAAKVDMAVKSITNPSLQKEASRFIGGRTDFMGESQKKNMQPGDITRGKGYNFHGWFYDARLPKPAPVPKMVSSQSRPVATADKTKPKVIVNNINKSNQSPSVVSNGSKKQQTVSYSFDPLKFIRELTMRRSR